MKLLKDIKVKSEVNSKILKILFPEGFEMKLDKHLEFYDSDEEIKKEISKKMELEIKNKMKILKN